jgi:hypothetical protein
MNPNPSATPPQPPPSPYIKLIDRSIFRWYNYDPETDTSAFSPSLGEYSPTSSPI